MTKKARASGKRAPAKMKESFKGEHILVAEVQKWSNENAKISAKLDQVEKHRSELIQRTNEIRLELFAAQKALKKMREVYGVGKPDPEMVGDSGESVPEHPPES